MLKKLRIRFVCINMAIVLVMLSVILGMVVTFTRSNMERETLSMMESVAKEPMRSNWPGSADTRLPYFTVLITPFGTVAFGNSGEPRAYSSAAGQTE